MKPLLLFSVLLLAACQRDQDFLLVRERPLFYRVAVYDLDGSVNYSKVLYIKSVEFLSTPGKGKGHEDCDPKILPLFYKYLNIQNINNRAVLTWETTYEQNLDKFVIERSLNAVDFYPIGVVKPRGANVLYSYVD